MGIYDDSAGSAFWKGTPLVRYFARTEPDLSVVVSELNQTLRKYGERLQLDRIGEGVYLDARPHLLDLPASEGWNNNTGTATFVQPTNELSYWEFLDNNAIDRLEISLLLPNGWRGRDVAALRLVWATDGTSTSTMVLQSRIADYAIGSDLANGTGTVLFTSSNTITPSGTAHSMTTTEATVSGAFSSDADMIRVMAQRVSSNASDTNTDGLRLYAVQIEVE